jgi:hypothetical protein
MLAGADLKLSTSTFQGNKNATFIFFGLKSNTRNMENDNGAWGAQFSYPNDLIKARLGITKLGKTLLPEWVLFPVPT